MMGLQMMIISGGVRASDEQYFLTNIASGIDADISTNISGQNGAFFYAAEDLDDTGGSIGIPDGSSFKDITFSNINIQGGTNLEFRGLFARGEIDPCGSSTYDSGDFVELFYNVDGTGEVKALCFNPDLECGVPGDITNEPLYFDPNCDGDGGEGTVLSNVFSEYTFSIPNGNSLSIRIRVSMNGGSEEFAFDYFRVFSDTPVLPVELVAFQATAVEEGTFLSWTTASELNNKGFEIHRSEDGDQWNTLTFIPGHGTTLDEKQYVYMDQNPLHGTMYYRLKQIDYDGSFEYSPVKAVEFSAEFDFRLSPNPVSNYLQITLPQTDSRVLFINIFSSSGQLVKSLSTKTNGLYRIPINDLPSGTYFLDVFSNTHLTKVNVGKLSFVKM